MSSARRLRVRFVKKICISPYKFVKGSLFSGNVKAARDSNMAVILDLKEKLDVLTKSIQSLRKREKELTEQIAQMRSEDCAVKSCYHGNRLF